MTVVRVVKNRTSPTGSDAGLHPGLWARAAALSLALALGGCSFASDTLFGDGVDTTGETTAASPPPPPPAQTAESEDEGFFGGLFPDFFGDDEDDAAATGSATITPVTGGSMAPAVSYQGTTVVGQRVNQFRGDAQGLRGNLAAHNQQFDAVRGQAVSNANAYNATVGAIRSRLQIGTTPGNPELLALWQQAQGQLSASDADLTMLNQLSARVSADAGATGYLLDNVRNAFTLSGAVDEDHRQLRMLEDELMQASIGYDRLLQSLNGDISRQQQFVANERSGLVDLASGINAGQLYGSGVAARAGQAMAMAPTAAQRSTPVSFTDRRPLVVIRFDKPDVAYEPALYQALSRALERRPDAVFDLVAVTPNGGNSAAARRNADAVMRSMAGMGLPAERVAMASMSSPTAGSPEVHVYVR
ncbi:MAG: hypothetical protein SFV21_02225 [Rhodospirillaceae bacterium]|nr:hypothetical protein [Rhodospirillaceae bacterium]